MEEEFLDGNDFPHEEENFVEFNVEDIETSFQPLQHSKATMNLLSGVQPVKKRELTYDDILGSMNLKVVDGQLQYIQPQKPTNFMKKVTFSAPVEKDKIQHNSQYMNYVPRSKEEHQKMMREHIKKQIELRERNKKSTKLFFTNHLPEPTMPNVTGGNHFLNFVKNKIPMRPFR
jgi:hypothetical protein